MSSPSVPSLRLPLRPSPLPCRASAAGSSLALAPSSRAALLIKLLASRSPASYHQRRWHGPPAIAATTTTSKPVLKDPKKFQEWDYMTAKFAGAANVPFLLLQLPQIFLNARNLLAGNKTALFAVPWVGCSLGCSETSLCCPISPRRRGQMLSSCRLWASSPPMLPSSSLPWQSPCRCRSLWPLRSSWPPACS
ncbi:maltose excess protein 1-like, chloroplastic [Phragmites australis]|uniref:maltose excess protein 1-like, chloroplastic n=1 Tax=Phragmites australis TaxID=29695 RepID=UPI002D7A1558|nr:maltose excess protein 1-like, chloroplastic [Phragmites australis]XP_062226624.1 maltose excess protein 1-like, chloroplastic [Phragmites australis]XP_062226625.1 maltose excess protein 1-like, chloroplastic [Phragmites australis]